MALDHRLVAFVSVATCIWLVIRRRQAQPQEEQSSKEARLDWMSQCPSVVLFIQ